MCAVGSIAVCDGRRGGNPPNPPPAAVNRPKRLFSDAIYVRGAMTLEALRERIGNHAFYATLRDWVRRTT